MASFDENGKYIKTNWKAGDKITATKLNKIEESIEAVNDNDISRHVEADARLDALEAKDVAHDKEFTNVKNLIADNKAAAELDDYEINSRMQFLEDELEEAVAEVNNVAETVDGKIATAEANMAAQVNQGKADMEAMVAEVDTNVDNKLSAFVTEVNSSITSGDATLQGNIDTLQANLEAADATLQGNIDTLQANLEAADATLQNDIDERLPLSGGTITGSVQLDISESERSIDFVSNNQTLTFWYGVDNLGEASGPRMGWYDRVNERHIMYYDTANVTIGIPCPLYIGANLTPRIANWMNLGSTENRWNTIYLVNNPSVSSDRVMKENIEYIGKAKSELTYTDMYNFVKDDLGLATYNFIGDDKLRMNFIAQDLLVNEDGTDNKIGQMIVNPVAVPTEEEIEEGTPYPTLSYDTGMYTSVLAGALKEAINKIEQLEARINELENK